MQGEAESTGECGGQRASPPELAKTVGETDFPRPRVWQGLTAKRQEAPDGMCGATHLTAEGKRGTHDAGAC